MYYLYTMEKSSVFSGIKINEKSFFLILSFFAVLSLALTYFATKWGAWVFPDSIAYIEVARNFIAGNGLSLQAPDGSFNILRHYPPLYPIILSLSACIGIDPLEGARVLCLIVSALSIFVWGKCAQAVLLNNKLALLFAALLVLSPQWLGQHGMALSDPLFTLLLGLIVLIVQENFEEEELSLLAAIAILTSLCVLTRYAGGAVAAWVVLVLVYLKRDCLRRIFKFVLFCGLPVFAWVFYVQNNSEGIRSLAYHPPSGQKLLGLLNTLGVWIVPTATGNFLLIVGGLVSLVVLFFLLQYLRQKEVPLIFSFPAIYLLFIIFSASFLDAGIPFNQRILFPAFPVFLLCVFYLASNFIQSRGVLSALAFAVLIGLVFFIETYSLVKKRNAEGLGFASPKWYNSEIVRQVKNLDPSIGLYSNAPDAISLFTGRNTHSLPIWAKPGTREPSSTYKQEMGHLVYRMSEQGYQIVYFRNITWRWYLPNEQQLNQILPLKATQDASDGAIYSLKVYKRGLGK